MDSFIALKSHTCLDVIYGMNILHGIQYNFPNLKGKKSSLINLKQQQIDRLILWLHIGLLSLSHEQIYQGESSW